MGCGLLLKMLPGYLAAIRRNFSVTKLSQKRNANKRTQCGFIKAQHPRGQKVTGVLLNATRLL
jgi:hypothetical protein